MRSDERRIGSYRGRMLLVLVVTWGLVQVSRYLLPPLLPEIRADLSLSLAQAGIVLSVMQGVYGIVQYPGGRLSDAWSRATLLVPAVLVSVAGVLVIGGATGYLVLLVGVGIFGLGRGLYTTPARTLVSDLFVDTRGRALGVFSAGSDLGGVLASGAAVAVIALATWRAAFLPIALVLAALLALFVALNEEPYAVTRTRLDVVETGRRILATPRQRSAILAFSLFFVMIHGVLNFLPEYLRQAKGFSPGLAGLGFSFVFVAGMIVKPLAGGISDRFPRRLVSVASIVLTMVALGLLLVVESTAGIMAAIVLFALAYKGQYPVIDAILLDAAPDDNMGGDIGAARTVFHGVGSLGPALVGAVADRYDFTVAFAVLVAMLAVASMLLARQGR